MTIWTAWRSPANVLYQVSAYSDDYVVNTHARQRGIQVINFSCQNAGSSINNTAYSAYSVRSYGGLDFLMVVSQREGIICKTQCRRRWGRGLGNGQLGSTREIRILHRAFYLPAWAISRFIRFVATSCGGASLVAIALSPFQKAGRTNVIGRNIGVSLASTWEVNRTQSRMDTRGRPHARLLCRRYGSKIINTIVMIHRQTRYVIFVPWLGDPSVFGRSSGAPVRRSSVVHTHTHTWGTHASTCFADVLSTVLEDNTVSRS